MKSHYIQRRQCVNSGNAMAGVGLKRSVGLALLLS